MRDFILALKEWVSASKRITPSMIYKDEISYLRERITHLEKENAALIDRVLAVNRVSPVHQAARLAPAPTSYKPAYEAAIDDMEETVTKQKNLRELMQQAAQNWKETQSGN